MLEEIEKRIFCLSSDAVKEKYLPLKRLIEVDYTYYNITDMKKAINQSDVFEIIKQQLFLKKTIVR